MLKQLLAIGRLFAGDTKYLIGALGSEDGVVKTRLVFHPDTKGGSAADCSGEGPSVGPEAHVFRVKGGKVAEHWGERPIFSIDLGYTGSG